MQVVYPRCAAIDVAKKEIAVSVRTPGDEPGGRRTQVRKYKTFYGVLKEMCAWLAECRVTHVAMESTGIYSNPVYYALAESGDFEVIKCNAAHARNVPGRKTAADCVWLAELLECGLTQRGCAGPTSRPRTSPSCGTSPATGTSWSARAPARSKGCRRRWRTAASIAAMCSSTRSSSRSRAAAGSHLTAAAFRAWAVRSSGVKGMAVSPAMPPPGNIGAVCRATVTRGKDAAFSIGPMAAQVMTASPRVPVDELERRTRARLARDGAAAVAAQTADGRQSRQLRRLAWSLAADPGLQITVTDGSDGTTTMGVWVAGTPCPAWRGEPKTL